MNIIIFSSPLHDGNSVISCREELFEELSPETIVPYNVDNLPKADAVCFIATGGTEEIFLQTLPRLKAPIRLLCDGFHNSMAATFEIATYLERNGIEHEIINYGEIQKKGKKIVPAGDDEDEIKVHPIYKVERVKNYLANSVIGIIGGKSSWLIASDVDKEFVQKAYGVKFVDIDINEIPAGKDMYESIKAIVEKYGLTALTLKCFDLLKRCNDTACLALAKLNAEGIISGCEGDIPSLWTMMVSYALTGTAPFMSNPSATDRESLTVDFAHCTVPLSMVTDYSLTTHFESGIGVGVKGILAEGPYTLMKIGGEKLDQIFMESGVITCNTDVAQRCRTQIRFQFNDLYAYRHFMTNRLGNHVVIQKNF
ncbi:MAG: hypothetical protein HUJ95_07500 [Bacteroidales bacterium]|nr:hypothetical protein [Bacteroidales bacterium]